MKDEPIVCTVTASTTGRCPYSGVAHAAVYVPVGSSITTLTFFPEHTIAGTVTRSTVAMADSTNTTISLTVAAGRTTQMPLELSALENFAIKADAAGTVYVTGKD